MRLSMMNTRSFLRGLLLMLVAALLPGLSRAEGMTEKAKIEALISHVEGLQGAKFIRNGKEYGAKDAAKFLRGKWSSKEKEIQTANDFIDKVATVSSTTGQSYMIRLSDSKEVKCAEYLKGELKKLESK